MLFWFAGVESSSPNPAASLAVPMATALYAMAINFDVTTEGGLAHLDNYLLTRSFISGFPGVSVGVVFEQIQTVHFEDDAVREEAPPPARRATEEAAGRVSAAETARRASEETARKTSADTGRDRNILENGNHQNGDDSLHLLVDKTDHVNEAMPSGGQASEGRVSESGLMDCCSPFSVALRRSSKTQLIISIVLKTRFLKVENRPYFWMLNPGMTRLTWRPSKQLFALFSCPVFTGEPQKWNLWRSRSESCRS